MKKTLIAILSVLTVASFNAQAATPKEELLIPNYPSYMKDPKGLVVKSQYESLVTSFVELNKQLDSVWDFYDTMNKSYGVAGVPDEVLNHEFERVTGLKRHMSKQELITHLWANDPQLLEISSTLISDNGSVKITGKNLSDYDVLEKVDVINKINLQLVKAGFFGDKTKENSIIQLKDISQPDLDIYKIRLFGLLLTDYMSQAIGIKDIE